MGKGSLILAYVEYYLIITSIGTRISSCEELQLNNGTGNPVLLDKLLPEHIEGA